MKKLMLSTALLGSLALPVAAQDMETFRSAGEMDIRASDFMGMRVYASEAAVEGDEAAGLQEGWEDIGEINDIVVDREGMVQAVLVDIGGFLGIGERTVAVSMDAIRFLSDSATAEEADDFFLVLNATREQLEGAPEYTVELEGEMTAEEAVEETEGAIDEAAADVAAAGAAAGAAVEGAAEEAGDEMAEAAEGVENAVEETGEEMADAGEEVADEAADAGAEVADEAADAGAEVAEEVEQLDMTDEQEDVAEAADEAADAEAEATEETAQAEAEVAEEAAQAEAEVADEAADQAEAVAEGTADEEMATDEMATEEAAATDEMATEEAATSDMAAEEMPAREPIVREGFVAAGAEDFTAERLDGAPVFDGTDERVGEVGAILMSEDGQVNQLVIDVGGFLGIGEKPVALDIASVDILRQDGGEEIRVFVSQTEEELEAMERYEE